MTIFIVFAIIGAILGFCLKPLNDGAAPSGFIRPSPRGLGGQPLCFSCCADDRVMPVPFLSYMGQISSLCNCVRFYSTKNVLWSLYFSFEKNSTVRNLDFLLSFITFMQPIRSQFNASLGSIKVLHQKVVH